MNSILDWVRMSIGMREWRCRMLPLDNDVRTASEIAVFAVDLEGEVGDVLKKAPEFPIIDTCHSQSSVNSNPSGANSQAHPCIAITGRGRQQFRLILESDVFVEPFAS
jgi:hypothetical protein